MMKQILFALITGILVSSVNAQDSTSDSRIVVLETTQGVIEIRLMPDVAPRACENFIKLIEQGYYDGIIFHSCLLYTSPSPRDGLLSRMPSSA